MYPFQLDGGTDQLRSIVTIELPYFALRSDEVPEGFLCRFHIPLCIGCETQPLTGLIPEDDGIRHGSGQFIELLSKLATSIATIGTEL